MDRRDDPYDIGPPRNARGPAGGSLEARSELLECVGPYRLLHLLGRGGAAEVFLARHSDLPGLFALKRLQAHGERDKVARGLLADEARIGGQLRHPSVISALDANLRAPRPWIAMPFVDGPSLGQLMHAMKIQATLLSWRAAVSIGIGMADALHVVHTARHRDGLPLGIIHRDLSPANVLLATHGRTCLADFGIARFTGRSSETSRGKIRGTLVWMAPEQLRAEPIDQRADLFALGLLLYQLTARRHPFESRSIGETARAINRGDHVPLGGARPDVPRYLSNLVEACLQPRPEDRPHSANEVRMALRCLLEPGTDPHEHVRDAIGQHFVWNRDNATSPRPWHAVSSRSRLPAQERPAWPQKKPASSWDPATAVTLPPVARRALSMMALFLLMVVSSGPAHAAYRHLDRPELCAASDLVVLAESTSAESFWTEGDSGAIQTRTWFAPLQEVVGTPARRNAVELLQAGGEIDGVRMETSGMEDIAQDTAYLLFLQAQPDGTYRMVAGPQSLVRIARDEHEPGESLSTAFRSLGSCGR